MGASLRETGSHPSGQAASHLDASLFDPARDRKIVRLYQQGVAVSEIARRVKHGGVDGVYRALRRNGVPERAASLRERRDSRADEVRKLRAEGRSLSEIGAALGITGERARQLLLPRAPTQRAVIEQLIEALVDWRNCWLCPCTGFEAEVSRLLGETDAILAKARGQ